MKIILSFLMTLLFVTTSNARMEDRLETILSGGLDVAVDTFIVGTHDKYIATVVRGLDPEAVAGLTMTMRQILDLYDSDSVVLVEKHVFDKNAKRTSLAERDLALKSDYLKRLATEPSINSELQEVEPGSLNGLLWEKVAGPNGLGAKILGKYPEPVTLTDEYKRPTDTERYALVMRKTIGGLFLDRNSIKKTDEGCSALMVEAFNFDEEANYGGMVMQYAYQPYVDAHYAVSMYEYSFPKRAYRQVNLTIFSPDNKVIYSIKNSDNTWKTEDMDPMLPFSFMAVRRNLPENIVKLLADDITSFDAYVEEKIAESKEKASDTKGDQE